MGFGNIVGDIAAGALGAGISAWGQSSANAANAKMTREQMRWQEHMRGTSWQTAVKDMRAAGINPMLAVSQGGAGTGSASSIPQQSIAPDIPRHISSALEVSRFNKELELLQSQIDNVNSQTNAVNVGADKTRQDIKINEPQASVSDTWLGRIMPYFSILPAATMAAGAIGSSASKVASLMKRLPSSSRSVSGGYSQAPVVTGSPVVQHATYNVPHSAASVNHKPYIPIIHKSYENPYVSPRIHK